MPYIRDLRHKLQVKRNNVLKADKEMFNHHLSLFFEFLNNTRLFKNILQEIKYNKAGIDDWLEDLATKRVLKIPNTEKEKVSLCFGLLQHCLEEDADAAWHIGHVVTSKGVGPGLDWFKEQIFEPFYEYIDARTDEGNSVLYLIERFKLRSEWFDKERLYQLYESDTSRGENNLRTELRRYLFDHGIDYPFVDLKLPSGSADIAADLDTENALVSEVKLFNPEQGYERSYIRKGFKQAYDYTGDFNKPYGYYIIFNLSTKDLQIRTSSNKSAPYPITIETGDKTIFIVIINIYPFAEPASRRRKLKPYIIEEDYLKSEEE